MNILLVVDLQKGFIKNSVMQSVADKIVSLVDSDKFDAVIATRFRNFPGSPYERFLSYRAMIEPDDYDLVEGFRNYTKMLDRSCYSCMTDEMLVTLRSLNGGSLPLELFICGTDVDQCILATAMSAFDLGIRPIVLAEYSMSSGGNTAAAQGYRVLERAIGSKQICPTREAEAPQDCMMAGVFKHRFTNDHAED